MGGETIMKKMILALFPKKEDADEALFHLTDDGFKSEEISVIAREDRMEQYRSKRTKGDATVTGALLGGLAGLLIVATPIVLPGVGVLVAGPLTALTGLALGTLTGGIIGALVDIGLSEPQARQYEKRIKEGGVLLSVPVDDNHLDKARKILEGHNAEEVTVIRYLEQKGARRAQSIPL
jgi:uncharacterized membrane protein